MNNKLKKTLAGGSAFIIFFLIWHFGTYNTQLGALMPGPIEVIKAFVNGLIHNIGSYTIIGHVLWSVSRVLIAFAAGSIIGIGLGLLMSWFKLVEAIFKPIYSIIRPIPPIAWIPLAILWFGLGEMTKYFIIFLAAFANVTLNTYDGAKSVDPHIIGAARMLGAKNMQLLTTIVIPATVPYIFAGLQVAISSCWATVVAAEMVRSSEGVGWMIVSGMEINNMTQILVGIIAISIVGFLLATLMRGAENVLCRWRQR